MIYINNDLVDPISENAKRVERLRMNYNFHKDAIDPMHRMLNAMEPGTYVRPHKHENPDKREAFIILRGTILIIEFDEAGKIISHIILNNSKGNFGVEIPPATYHTLIVLESNSVIYEVKDGPYNFANDKNFAPWAPEEGSLEGLQFIESKLKELSIELIKTT